MYTSHENIFAKLKTYTADVLIERFMETGIICLKEKLEVKTKSYNCMSKILWHLKKCQRNQKKKAKLRASQRERIYTVYTPFYSALDVIRSFWLFLSLGLLYISAVMVCFGETIYWMLQNKSEDTRYFNFRKNTRMYELRVNKVVVSTRNRKRGH